MSDPMTTAPREATRHVLKCWATYFDAVADGRKPFEVRKDDRDYQVGDVLELHRIDDEGGYKTGQTIERLVTYALRPELFAGVAVGYVVLGLSSLPREEPEGYVLVPKEPTREMWAAMGDAIVGYRQRHHDKVAEQIWTAALTHAPALKDPTS